MEGQPMGAGQSIAYASEKARDMTEAEVLAAQQRELRAVTLGQVRDAHRQADADVDALEGALQAARERQHIFRSAAEAAEQVDVPQPGPVPDGRGF